MAAETIRELVVKYGIDVDTGPMEQFDEAIKNITQGLLGLGAVVLSSAVGIFGITQSAATAGDELEKLSQRVGVSMADLQQLRFASKLNNEEFDQFAQGLSILNRNMTGAAGGSAELAKAFKAVGIPLDQVKNGSLDAGEAVTIISKQLENMPDGAQKSALAMQIFGKQGAALIPVLKDIAGGMTQVQMAVMELNAITPEQAKAGAEFNDSLLLMKQAAGGILQQVGQGLVPVLKDLFDEMTQFIVANKQLIKQNVAGFVEGLAVSLKTAWKFVRVLANAATGMMEAFGGVGNSVKFVLGVITALSGGAILYGIGGLVSATWAFVGAITAANVAALAIPIAIGAAVVLVGLVIEDLIAFFQGRDSVTGIIVDKFKEMLDWFYTAFPNLTGFLSGVFNLIGAVIKAFVTGYLAYLKFWFDGLVAVAKILGIVLVPVFNAISAAIGFAVDQLSKFFGLVGKVGGGILGGIGGGAQFLANGLNSLSGNGPSLSPSAAAGAGGTGGNVTQQNQIDISVPAGTDPAAVGPYVERGLSNSLDPVLRSAQRAGVSGVAY